MSKQACVSTNGHLKKFTRWFTKALSSKILFDKNEPQKPVKPILCLDNSTTCDPLKTCCMMSDNSYGCCNYVDGVCCRDFCCPSGNVCGKRKGWSQLFNFNFFCLFTIQFEFKQFSEIYLKRMICPKGNFFPPKKLSEVPASLNLLYIFYLLEPRL
jgi:hypothetical protein